jgi:hypothetical protein
VLSDGLACFGGVVEAGMKHTAIVTGSGSALLLPAISTCILVPPMRGATQSPG